MLISLSAKPKIESYLWYKFDGVRPVKFFEAHKTYDLEIEKGDVFGIKRGSKPNTVSLLFGEQPDIIFRPELKAVKRMIDKSVGFSGKVGNVKRVKAGKSGKDHKEDSKPIAVAPQHSEPLTVQPVGEDKGLTSALKRVKFPGMRNVKYMMTQKSEENEILQYYDVGNSLVNYRRKNKIKANEYGNFAYDLSLEVEKFLKNAYVEVGTVRFNGKVMQVMVVAED